MSSNNSSLIRELNDKFRQTGIGGRTCITQGIQAEGDAFARKCLMAVSAFNDFNRDNDPYQEHDFGALKVDGQSVFFKLDYYAKDMQHGSPDPSDENVTTRVMTIMLADEY